MRWKRIQSISSSVSSAHDFENEQELENMYDYLIKLIIIGPSGSGKTCMLHRFVKNDKVVKFGAGPRKKRIKLQLWDTAGQERFRSVTRSYYQAAAGALLVYDITNHDSFTSLPSWLKDTRALASPDVVVVLIGNKSDRNREREVTVNEAMGYANREGISMLEVSALTPHLIDDAFLLVARQILGKIELGHIDPNLPQFGIQYGDDGMYDWPTRGSLRGTFMWRKDYMRWSEYLRNAIKKDDNISDSNRGWGCLC
ncbi:hypothetical protein MERGE_001957 [Pneumocystis wakefieldiae]|uniref:Small GTP-binding protein domain n=1 Tax=Pneumocystis wakefieldiae TaxID=38082 RepID=A0A899FWH3_9ASCO|nr:hypothetical protein MERGE_001957 [Pneumocystis wakefieldiae]